MPLVLGNPDPIVQDIHIFWDTPTSLGGQRAGAPIINPMVALNEGTPTWQGLGSTWTPKVCKILAFMAVCMGSGL